MNVCVHVCVCMCVCVSVCVVYGVCVAYGACVVYGACVYGLLYIKYTSACKPQTKRSVYIFTARVTLYVIITQNAAVPCYSVCRFPLKSYQVWCLDE